jgi:hypothetical protein
MSEAVTNSQSTLQAETELHQADNEQKGVLPKNLKPSLYLSAALLVIVAAVFSDTGKRAATQHGAALRQAPTPGLQDNAESNQQELRSDAAAAEQRMPEEGANATDPPTHKMTPAQQAPTALTASRTRVFPDSPARRSLVDMRSSNYRLCSRRPNNLLPTTARTCSFRQEPWYWAKPGRLARRKSAINAGRVFGGPRPVLGTRSGRRRGGERQGQQPIHQSILR